MNKMGETIIKYITDQDYRFRVNVYVLKMYKNMPDEEYLRRLFHACLGYDLNLADPQTFDEKLQWLKLYDRRPEYTQMVDKYLAKQYVADRIGNDYIVPLIGVWEKFEDIDFEKLPNQFVLKCTHDCGGLVICKDKSKLDIKSAQKKINRSLKSDYYLSGREWPYKNVKRRIIAEEYLEDSGTGELRDYKFFAFDGKVRALFIAQDRQKLGEETKFDFFDADFNHLPIKNGHPNADLVPQKPENFELMRVLAEKLSCGIPQVRVDFYEANGKVYFGELTLSHWSGLVPFEPFEWDKKFGSWIVLPKAKA